MKEDLDGLQGSIEVTNVSENGRLNMIASLNNIILALETSDILSVSGGIMIHNLDKVIAIDSDLKIYF